jgi:hypothetical protein
MELSQSMPLLQVGRWQVGHHDLVGPSDLVMQLKSNLMQQFNCDDCGHLEEYVALVTRLRTLATMSFDLYRLF